MYERLNSADVTLWYKKLNFARTQAGISLNPVTEAACKKTATSERILQLLHNISSTRSENYFLGLSTSAIKQENFSSGKPINQSDRQSIESSLLSLLRICPNVNCQTVCTNTGANSNASNGNGTCSNVVKSNAYNENVVNSNGANSNGANSNGTNSNGNNGNGLFDLSGNNNTTCGFSGRDVHTHGNGTCANGAYSNVAFSNVAHGNGTNTNGIKSNAYNANGTNTNGVKTNGNTNAIYDPNTVTYSARNHYSEEYAANRVT